MSENNSEYILVDNAEKMQLVLASLASMFYFNKNKIN